MIRYVSFLLIYLFLWSCSKNETIPNEFIDNVNLVDENNDNAVNWHIDDSNIFGSYEPFPEIDSVVFRHSIDKQISDNHRVALLNIEGQDIAILFGDLSYFEVINVTYNNRHISVTHCPLTNTTIAFEMQKDENLKASGFRLHDNLILYNPQSDSYYSQMLLQQIGGKQNKLGRTIPIIDTKWSTAKLIVENLLIVQIEDSDLGKFNLERLYEENSSNWEFMSISMDIDPIKNNVNLLDLKFSETRFLCAINGRIIIGNTDMHLIRSFVVPEDLILSLNDQPSSMVDNLGNKYNWNGNCLNCNQNNKNLTVVPSYLGSTESFTPLFENINRFK